MSAQNIELRKTLALALLALNVAPRFLVPGAPEGLQDSYRICAEIERVLQTLSGVQS